MVQSIVYFFIKPHDLANQMRTKTLEFSLNLKQHSHDFCIPPAIWIIKD